MIYEDILKYNNNHKNYFDKILLFKPQDNLTYIRKLSMSYGYYTALAIVDNHDRVTHIGAKNNFRILPFNKLSRRYKNLLGNERCKRLDDDDIMSIYQVIEPLPLKQNYKLLKPCRSMRYALSYETYRIKHIILETLSEKHNVDINDVEKLGEYIDLYKKDIPLNFNEILYGTDEIIDDEIRLQSYDTEGAKGQTKLL